MCGLASSFYYWVEWRFVGITSIDECLKFICPWWRRFLNKQKLPDCTAFINFYKKENHRNFDWIALRTNCLGRLIFETVSRIFIICLNKIGFQLHIFVYPLVSFSILRSFIFSPYSLLHVDIDWTMDNFSFLPFSSLPKEKWLLLLPILTPSAVIMGHFHWCRGKILIKWRAKKIVRHYLFMPFN